jgi:GTP-binding protein HflX
MKETVSTARKQERAVLVGLIHDHQTLEKVQEYLDELEFLATTAEIVTEKQFTQKLHSPDRRTYIGSGKLEEIKEFVEDQQIDIIIFDDELSPSQLRNIEKEFNKKVMDRSDLILEIFASRARTAHAKAQVELARSQYMLPRLTGLWTHLERQRGGTGTRGGAGEKEIETDRRVIRDRISKLKKQLEQIDKQKAVQRSNRGKLVRVALVGYTNVGKSTLMNTLSKSETFAEDKLFATLDTTVRKVVLGNLPFLLSDTVGFIRKLPHQLVESFKSTLDEVRESDLLIHVVDISHANFEDHYRTVNKTLDEIGASDIPSILVFNKIDAHVVPDFDEDDLEVERPPTLEELRKTWMARMDKHNAVVFISALNKLNIDELRNTLYEQIKIIHVGRYPYDDLYY